MASTGRTSKGTGGSDEVPRQFANVPPSPLLDHSFTLQAIMELQKTMATVGAKVDRLITDVEGQATSIGALQSQSTFIKGWIAGVGVVVTVVVAVAGFLLSSKADAVLAAVQAIQKH